MSHDKAIESGKERRRQYMGAKSIDKSCRNHGGCPHCTGNRLHNFLRRKLHASQDIKDGLMEWSFSRIQEDV